MGTKITLYVEVYGEGARAEKITQEAVNMLLRYEEVFSANRENSQLAMLKYAAELKPQKVDEELYDLIKVGKEHSLHQGSFLNIAIGPLIKLWKIGFREAHVPEDSEIKRVLGLLNPENIQLDDEQKTVFLLKKGMEIDLGAIAKGYFADQVMAFFKKNGATSAMVDMGGNVLVYGDSPTGDCYWKVGIQNPFLPRGNAVALVRIKDQSVVTSGIYERVLEKDGAHYHHIFDSTTGYPVENNVASLTIIADRSVDCDIYTTKLFGLDAASIIRSVSNIKGMGAIVITMDGQMAFTDNLRGKLDFQG
jgi:thiamine biosynthesis lipoprotein